ncbi:MULTISPECIES: dipeptide ABC transporter ATP-binding protein [unclassified Variovorax]|uniref:ABC transporter ATP-binding protein n=1 Tax=unclassified Variovorax TaxID=663243 RepID=UPI00076CF3FD|nr:MULTISPECIES: dipeptide ABC transporter ATP-binding protein [unclassified Variovorax]KWT65746.1 Oligopeptide transport system permease protein OppB [Variovorax sp. WDL1]PNG56773.1 Glutathione import ATP-binding protein GsiA [Variovorax sp. B4]PNG58197.1 Glutathione import ATP-binding protein GsiA [Variovorax sp. B2]VTV09294.1 Glutathione import ATP-binding protein GsiA [Variovorax sp. WDL1]
MSTALLEVRGLRVSFGGKEVVRGIDFGIAPCEKLALVGESGSGKTVTALSLLRLALNAEVSGHARLAGNGEGAGPRDLLTLPERDLRAIRGKEVAMIFQEPMTALNALYTVGDQIAEVLEVHEALPRRAAQEAAVQLLADTGIPEPARRARAFPHQLSGGQRQRAMIAMALACKPRLLLADEPTTALDVTVRAQILDLLAELQDKHRMAVLMITHDLNMVRRFADRVAVMENGAIVEQGAVAQVFGTPQHAYTRKLIDSRPARDVPPVPSQQEPPVLEAQGLRVSYPVSRPGFAGWFRKGEFVAVQGADFRIGQGETLGVVGESGSGKSTLALAALGLLRHGGSLGVTGQRWNSGRASDRALRRQMQVVFQDPFSSLSPRMTVEQIVGEGLTVHAPELDIAARRVRALEALADVGLTEAQFPSLLDRYPHEFSGGQRQRLAIARALIVGPRLLVLDEPTSALDVTIQKQVLGLLQRLQRERGLSYLLITHDVEVIRAMAHQVIVMKDGAILESGAALRVLDAPEHPYTQKLVAAAVG